MNTPTDDGRIVTIDELYIVIRDIDPELIRVIQGPLEDNFSEMCSGGPDETIYPTVVIQEVWPTDTPSDPVQFKSEWEKNYPQDDCRVITRTDANGQVEAVCLLSIFESNVIIFGKLPSSVPVPAKNETYHCAVDDMFEPELDELERLAKHAAILESFNLDGAGYLVRECEIGSIEMVHCALDLGDPGVLLRKTFSFGNECIVTVGVAFGPRTALTRGARCVVKSDLTLSAH